MLEKRRTSIIVTSILLALFGLSLYIRVVLPFDSVFGGFIRFGGNDPWFHMRLIENTIHNFPERISFDPYTFYPHGDLLHFGPLYDQMIAFFAILAGLGAPSLHLIKVVGAYFPAILGALTVFPVYFIVKELFDNRNIGIISAALIAVLPGQFLSRSLLGFTDHHIAETLFSTITILFLVLAIKSGKEEKLSFSSISRKPLIFAIFAGISFGIYQLMWTGALLLALIIVIYAIAQYIIDFLRGKSTDYLCIIGLPLFIVPLIMISPVIRIGGAFVSEIHLASYFVAIASLFVLSGLSKLEFHGKRFYYPFALLGVMLAGFIAFHLINPELLASMLGRFGVFSPKGGALTIAEAKPLLYLPGHFTLAPAWRNFTTGFFIVFIAIPLVIYRTFKERKSECILFLVWTIIMLIATLSQNRFSYYFAVNVAILSGYFGWKLMEWAGLKELYEMYRRRFRGNLWRLIKRRVKVKHIIVVLVVGLILFYPNISAAITTAKHPGGPSYDWHSSLEWLRANTPDPFQNPSFYNKTYEIPEGDYPYPDSSYGVMSWWDYGHWITYIGKRIPNANPFQEGIGGPGPNGSIRPGASTFFIAKNESQANRVLDELGSRYIISDFMMADAVNSFYNKYAAMTVWAKDTSGHYDRYRTKNGVVSMLGKKYFETMETRLHMFDGREMEGNRSRIGNQSILMIESFHTKPLEHYRLIHESSRYMVPHAILNATTGDLRGWQCYARNYTQAKMLADMLHRGFRDPRNPNLVRWTPQFFSPVSYVKIFEYVKGAKIAVEDVANATISVNVTTNNNRTFTYTQAKTANDTLYFVVPYATGKNYDIVATEYTITADGQVKSISVPDEAVTKGKTIHVAF